jgi:hypothetical protein
MGSVQLVHAHLGRPGFGPDRRDTKEGHRPTHMIENRPDDRLSGADRAASPNCMLMPATAIRDR